jgi:hypothetical protein
MGEDKNTSQLKASAAVRAYQREWLQRVKEKVSQGEPFAICNGDEFEEIFNIMEIPFFVINYWNSLVAVKRMGEHYDKLLEEKDYTSPGNAEFHFAWGLASTLDNNPKTAPMGGLPKPTIIIGGTKSDLEMRVLEIWARENGCHFFPLEFGLNTNVDKLPPPRSWERIRDHWDELIESHKLDARVEEEKALIKFLEVTTGKKFSIEKLFKAIDLINEQMDYWKKAHDLIAETVPCPVGLRDQLSMYQAMWHRGTTTGRDLLKAYYEEVKERVDKGIGACPGEKLRLMWMAGTPPAWEKFVQEKYGAVCVCSSFSIPPIYFFKRAILNNDPLRALASRHMLLGVDGPELHLQEAKLHKCDAIVKYQSSKFRGAKALAETEGEFFEKAGMPFLEISGAENGMYRDDDEVRSILSNLIETRLLSKR